MEEQGRSDADGVTFPDKQTRLEADIVCRQNRSGIRLSLVADLLYGRSRYRQIKTFFELKALHAPGLQKILAPHMLCFCRGQKH